MEASKVGNIMRFLAVVFVVLSLAGCGGKVDPSHVSVSGKVTLNGEALAGAQITFIPLGKTQGIGAQARTGADGRYQLTDRRGQPGAAPGNYKVTISKRVMPNGSDVPADDPTPPIESPAREKLPTIYSNTARTTLKADIPPQGGDIDFPLKAQVK
jgi:hypothetical protein